MNEQNTSAAATPKGFGKSRVFRIVAAAVGIVAVLAAVTWMAFRQHAAKRIAERKVWLERFGIDSDGTQDFVPLPDQLPVQVYAARLGGELYVDRRLARNPYRVCGACHRLNEGGIDARALGGVLARPTYNAVFADVFLHDGSVTGMPALVRRMIESPAFCAGGPLSNIVARLAADEKTLTRFQQIYEDGVTENNLIDAIVQYERTLFTSAQLFDLWCAGRKDVFNARQTHGAELFRKRRCLDCHDGPALGTLKLVDGKKVPGLRGLSQRRAYLPDARTDLGSVLSLMPGGNLEARDRADLVSFLKTL